MLRCACLLVVWATRRRDSNAIREVQSPSIKASGLGLSIDLIVTTLLLDYMHRATHRNWDCTPKAYAIELVIHERTRVLLGWQLLAAFPIVRR